MLSGEGCSEDSARSVPGFFLPIARSVFFGDADLEASIETPFGALSTGLPVLLAIVA
jgi:hypothetical protein